MKRRLIAFGVVAMGVVVALYASMSCLAQRDVRAVKPVATVPEISARDLELTVRTLVNDFAPRGHDHPEQLDAAATWIRKKLERHAPVDEQTFTVAGKTYRNLVARFGPDTKTRVVVGAHYDTALGLPGADDDTSGTAGLLALAEPLATAKLGVAVELVAFTLEEPPYFATEHMGSVHHAKREKERGYDVRAMLSLEMIGCFSDMPQSQHFPAPGMSLLYPTTGNFIALVARPTDHDLIARVKASMLGATDLPVSSLAGPTFVQGVDWSDHRSYWAEGYPALMVTDTSFLRNPRYHTPQDTPDTLDYARMAKVVQGVFAAVVAIAQ
jgi:hypothetical protein